MSDEIDWDQAAEGADQERKGRREQPSTVPVLGESEAAMSKHDEGCRRRGDQFPTSLCTCDMTDTQVAAVRGGSEAAIRDQNGPVTVVLTRAQAWDIYDLTVARAVALHDLEIQACGPMGAKRYRDAADVLRGVLR